MNGENVVNKPKEMQDRRAEDMSVSAFGVKIKASGTNVILVLIAMGLFAAYTWHDYKADQANAASAKASSQIIEAIWFQTAILAVPQEGRGAMINKIPEAIRDKAGMIERR